MDRDVKQYAIRGNKASTVPRRSLYLDTETSKKVNGTEEIHRMMFAWSCYVEIRPAGVNDTVIWRFHNTRRALCKYIEGLTKDRTVLHIFGHNIFFDLQAASFFAYFTKAGWSLDFLYDAGLTYILNIRKGRRRIKCLSTTNYFPTSLKKLGQLVGLEKLDVDFELTPRKELIDYCRRDVEIVKAGVELWCQFLKDHDLGSFALSRAGQAFRAFRHRFKKSKVCFHRDNELSEYERKAYFGGRVECFELGRIGGGPFISLDVNSMYPYVMKEYEYPSRFVFLKENPTARKVEKTIGEYCVVADVSLSTQKPAYAIRLNGKCCFPTGRFRTSICSAGLKYALENNHIVCVHSIAAYRKAPLFIDYVDYFYGLKQKYQEDDNRIMARIAKDMLNSLYGKFAQKKPLITEEDDITFDGYFREEIYDMISGNMNTVTKLFNKRFMTNGFEPGRNSLVTVSAHVTEYARFHLWEILEGIGLHRVLYCDTDSVKIRKKHRRYVNHKISASELGALKIEETFSELTINGCKDYSTEYMRKLKGVPAAASRVGEYRFKYQEFCRQNTHLRRRQDAGFIVREVIKDCTPSYDKGQVIEGGRVVPFCLEVS